MTVARSEYVTGELLVVCLDLTMGMTVACTMELVRVYVKVPLMDEN